MKKRFPILGFIFFGFVIAIYLMLMLTLKIDHFELNSVQILLMIFFYLFLLLSFLCFVGGFFFTTGKGFFISVIGFLLIIGSSLKSKILLQDFVKNINKEYIELRIQFFGPKDWLECQMKKGVLQYDYDAGKETCQIGEKTYIYNHKISDKVMSVEEFLSKSENLDSQDVTIKGVVTFLGRADSLGLGYGIPGLISSKFKKTPGLARGVGLYTDLSDSERGKEIIVRGIYYAKDEAIRFPKIIKLSDL